MSAQAGNSSRSETAVFEDNTRAKQLKVSHPQKRKARVCTMQGQTCQERSTRPRYALNTYARAATRSQ